MEQLVQMITDPGVQIAIVSLTALAFFRSATKKTPEPKKTKDQIHKEIGQLLEELRDAP